MILGQMSSGLLPRVCAFGVPGQRKTHGHSGFENDFEDLETDLLAAFVANDVPAAFCAPEVFVDAAMIASDYWGLMLGAALSAFEDAAMLCFQKSEWDGETGASFLLKNGWVLGRFLELSGVLFDLMVNSGSSFCVSPMWPDGRLRRQLLQYGSCVRGCDGWMLLSCAVLPGMLPGCSQSKSSVCGALRHED